MNSIKSVKEYIREKLIEKELNKKSLYNKKEYKDFISFTGSNGNYSSYQREIQREYNNIINTIEEDELVSDNLVKLRAGKQALLDKNNVERKVNREANRLYNHLSELYQEYVKAISENKIDLNKLNIKGEKTQQGEWGILQLSDIHFNKLIKPCEEIDNEYNFTIASQRLKKFITEAIFYFKAKNIKNVYVAMTGDLLTSDRRESEKLNRVTNQVKASLLASYILAQVLLELNQHFGLRTGAICGNESRLQDIMSSDEYLSSSNYDFLIYNNLRIWLENTNIQFDIGGNYRERLVDIEGFKLLLLHGDTLGNSRDIGKQIKNIMTKHAIKGTKINCILAGHIHCCAISDIFSRSSSLIGVDNYSSIDLNLFDGRPSQNIYLINKDNSYNAMKIDLLNISGIKGYDIKKELEAYYIQESIRPNNEVIIRNFI
jgi:hypothetical protein